MKAYKVTIAHNGLEKTFCILSFDLIRAYKGFEEWYTKAYDPSTWSVTKVEKMLFDGVVHGFSA